MVDGGVPTAAEQSEPLPPQPEPQLLLHAPRGRVRAGLLHTRRCCIRRVRTTESSCCPGANRLPSGSVGLSVCPATGDALGACLITRFPGTAPSQAARGRWHWHQRRTSEKLFHYQSSRPGTLQHLRNPSSTPQPPHHRPAPSLTAGPL